MLDISTRIANLPPSKRKLLELALGNRDESLPSKAISRRSTTGEIPLSFAQQRMWFLDQLEPNHAAYHLAGAIRIDGPLQVGILEKAFNQVVQRHEILRTTFSSANDEPVQIIAPELVISLPLLDLQNVPESDRDAEVSRVATEWAQRPFALSEGPLLRAQLVRLSEEEHLLLLTLHHIIADGWSVGILIRELSSFYQGEELEELSIQYGDYAVWQRAWLQGEKLAEELGYWREQLAGAPAVLSLPTDHVRPAVQSFRGGRERLELPAELLRELQQLSQEQGATLFMTLLGAFQVLLWRLSGQRDVVVGTPIANRQRRELEGLIGFFANTLVLRTQVEGNESFRELLGRVKETCLGAYAHQDVPFEKLVEELQPERSLSHSPLFQVMFILQNAAQEDWRLGAEGLRFAVQGLNTAAAKFDLTLTLSEGVGGLQGWLEYNSDLFTASTIVRFGQHYECLLGSIVSEPGRAVGELEVLQPA
ncbi:MAG TPA: condensation domain-containing protein, partial [Pyrinomonadaceae bacterium]|nr:condensation domain-containing protein [Pyrinomonadaceae bacterium]